MPQHYCSAGRHYAGECPDTEPITWVTNRDGSMEPRLVCHFAIYPNPGAASCPEHAHLTSKDFQPTEEDMWPVDAEVRQKIDDTIAKVRAGG